jgi:hypothetical protein
MKARGFGFVGIHCSNYVKIEYCVNIIFVFMIICELVASQDQARVYSFLQIVASILIVMK